MLSRKTLRVAGATILGSLALLAANPASAEIRLNPAAGETAGKVKIARETLLTGSDNTTTVGGVTYHTITNATNLLDIVADRGIVAGTAAVYYRLTLENMVFVAAPPTPTAVGGATVAAVSGGAADDNYIVFSVAGTGTATDDVTVAPTTLGVLPDMPANIKLEVYRNAFDAQANANAIASLGTMMSGAVTVVDGISERGTPGTSVADVSEGFMQLTAGDTAAIGRLRLTLDTAAHDQALAPIVDFEDLFGTTAPVMVTFKGDFSVGAYHLDPHADCNKLDTDGTTDNEVDSTVADDGDMEKAKLTPDTPLTGAGTSVDWHLCLTVAEDNDMALPTGAFTATVEYGAIANALGGGREDQAVTIGSIGRNGTSVNIPYLTTDERYNQRIVIVNRGGEAAYSMTFSSEDGIMTAAGMMASGMLAANSTTVLKTTDVVTITGGPPHRASGMLNVVGPSSNISVASNQTTKMGGSTDTVVYEVD